MENEREGASREIPLYKERYNIIYVIMVSHFFLPVMMRFKAYCLS